MMYKILSLFSVLIFTLEVSAAVKRPPQFVMLAFDGSKDVGFWKESQAFADATATNQPDADGKDAPGFLRFTYFASGVYFIADNTKEIYVEPAKGAGKSAIGFGGTTANLKPRVEQMAKAMEAEHEIASHGNAHYDASAYTEAQWDKEFDQFEVLMKNAWKGKAQGWKNKAGSSIGADQADKEPKNWVSYFENDVIGFRAPLLGVGNGLWPALVKHKFAYDTSRVDKMNYWPKKVNGIWNFPLSGLKIVGSGKNTLSMDYNFYFTQSKGVAGPANKFKTYEDEMYNTYIEYFKNNYNGNRAPVHIGHHFSKWNGGAYWKAMQRFASKVCNQPEVRCVTYKELAKFMDATTKDPNLVAAYQKGDFEKSTVVVKGLTDSRSLAQELSDDEMEEVRKSASDHFKAHQEDYH